MTAQILEISSVILNLLFIYFLMEEKRICWWFGIAGSILSGILFFRLNLYSEAILFAFYVLIGLYGWLVWKQKSNRFLIRELKTVQHAMLLAIGTLGFFILGRAMDSLKADKAYFDAFSTVFGIIASFLEIYKIRSAWIYWILLNLFSTWLYASKAVWIYAGLMLLYSYLSLVGFIDWNQKFSSQKKVTS
jgi:nicotinamide mononucleotide transporter